MLSAPSSAQPKPDYRPDIDGLRAISIIAIVLFHLDVPFTPGGFIGVDIFFVISGYLITRLIQHEYNNGTFSYLQFLERRMRRIYPALALLIATMALLGYTVVTFPEDRIQLGNSLIAQAWLSSELFFMSVNSYFDTSLEKNLLLHTWTLGVELKFYLLFPLLWLTYRLQKRWQTIAIIITTAAVSFGVSVYLTNLAPSASALNTPWLNLEALNLTAAYFFIASRLWEFLVGALVFLCSTKIHGPAVREGLSFFGLALIAYAATQFNDSTAFPGLLALVPVFGTACLIYANTENLTTIGRLLAFPLLVSIGIISYGLYLWHWPLIVLATLLFGEITLATSAVIVLLTVCLATASYHFVETPIRTHRFFASSFTFWTLVLVTLAGTFYAGMVIKNSWLADARLWERPENELVRHNNCGSALCFFGEQADAERTLLLWGDSHALSIAPLIDTLAQESKTRVIAMIHASCPPLYSLGKDVFMEPRRENCERATETVRNILATEQIDAAIIAARWGAYTIWNDGVDTHVYLESTRDEGSGPEASAAAFDAGTKETIEALLAFGIDVYALGNIPEGTDFDMRDTLSSYQYSVDVAVLIDRLTLEEQTAKLPQALTDSYESHQYKLLSPVHLFCDENDCYATKDGVLLYRDAAHLNYWGAFALRPLFEPIFK